MRSGNLRAHDDTDGLRCPQSPRGRLRVEAAGHPAEYEHSDQRFQNVPPVDLRNSRIHCRCHPDEPK